MGFNNALLMMRPWEDVSGVLLAGGQSERMGRDKCYLEWEGEALWRRQIGVLRDSGARRVLVAGPATGPWSEPVWDCTVVEDACPGRGPLSGLVGAFEAMKEVWLVALAVDMPLMKAAYLRGLVQRARETGKGCVPFFEGAFEPLSAVYPRAVGAIARDCLRRGEFSLQRCLHEAERAGLLGRCPVLPKEREFFRNFNTPLEFLREKNRGSPVTGS
jgi:molybdopterin-guanine dinucleotide biosynthesis protein A